ncbi:MAG: malate synthase A, partial [Alphaproteobacteria bacterium]
MATVTLSENPAGVEIHGVLDERVAGILNAESLTFLASLHRAFDPARQQLLALRATRQAGFDDGGLPHFRVASAALGAGDWTVAEVPEILQNRRVELAGAVDRQALISGLNAGAPVYVADMGAATSPTWDNLIDGQVNLRDRWRGALSLSNEAGEHRLDEDPAVLELGPRGWPMPEPRLLVDGEVMSGALFDFGLYAVHNAGAAQAVGGGIFVRLPGVEHHLEARLWDEVMAHGEAALGLAAGSIKACVRMETLPALFEMEEIIYELRERVVAASLGLEGLATSWITTLAGHDGFRLPDHASSATREGFLQAGA